jgi:hypothetical protein
VLPVDRSGARWVEATADPAPCHHRDPDGGQPAG